MIFSKIKYFVNNHSSSQSIESIRLMKGFGFFGLINYPLFYVYWKFVAETKVENFSFRGVATILCLGLVFINKWPKTLRPFIPWYWCLTLIFCFPFFGTYMFLLNNGDQIWVFNYTMGLFWCLLVTNIPLFSVIWLSGSILGVAWYLISGHQIMLEQSYVSILVHVVWVMGVAVLFMQRRDKVVAEKIEALKAVGGAIAHEMRTPLATISGGLSIVRDFLPKLVKSYSAAKAAQVPVEHIDGHQLKAIGKIPEHLEVVNRRALAVIDHLLMNIRETSGQREYKKFPISDCIQQAIDLYPFTDAEKSCVVFDSKQDFTVTADIVLLSHVFSNLIKNALYYVSKVPREGQIKIWIEKRGRVNYVHVRDNGIGMSADVQSRIFEKFYTTNKQGTGIGLAFCRDVMNSFDGDIKCLSVQGEYAEFILSFPSVKV